MNRIIVGIIGEARTGKSTIAKHLEFAWAFKEYSLSIPMKKAASHLFGWTMDFIEKHKEEVDPEYGISPREFLQYLGTEVLQHGLSERFPEFKKVTGRLIHMKRFHSFLSSTSQNRIVISDIRFPHEKNYLTLSLNRAIILKVTRDPALRVPYMVKKNHESETEMEGMEADFYVDNNGSFEHLYFQVDEIMNQVLGGKA